MTELPALVEVDGHVLTVTLNRPEKRNAINSHVMCLLADAWQRLDDDDELRVAILTGNGTTFCAGMDLVEIGQMGLPEPANEYMARVREEPAMLWRAWLKKDLP